jgi:hypothetical protein
MVSVSLEPPDAGDLPIPPANTQGATKTLMAAAALVMTMEGVLPPPRLPYAPGPGTYTQLWVAQISTMTREEIKEELRYGFLTILPDHQVCLIHSLGQHSSGLGRQTSAHNRFFGLLGANVGDQLPPVVMAPSPGLAPWLKVKDVHRNGALPRTSTMAEGQRCPPAGARRPPRTRRRNNQDGPTALIG